MPELVWNEYEVIECLGVLPETEEFFTSHYFKLIKNELVLAMTIWQIESCVAISISKETDSKPFVTIYILVRDKISFVNEKKSSYLVFRDCIVVSSEFWMHTDEEFINYFDKNIFPSKLDFELHVYPKLELKFS